MNDKHPVEVMMRRWLDAVLAGDWDTLADTIAEDHRFEDRRLGMKIALDKAGNIEQARVMGDLAKEWNFDVDLDVIETRGDRVGLVRQTYHSSDYLVSVLALMRLDENDLNAVFILFDEDDLGGAQAELEALAEPFA